MFKLLTGIKGIRKPKMTPFKGLLVAILVLVLLPSAVAATVTHDDDVIITGTLQVNSTSDFQDRLTVTNVEAIRSASTSSQGAVYQTFWDQASSRKGLFGYLNGYNPDFYFVNEIWNGSFIFSTASTTRMQIDEAGDISMTEDLDVAGDLTVDGTIYGELSENLVLEPPEGFSVAIAQGRALEANYIKALTGDEVIVDDDFEVTGEFQLGPPEGASMNCGPNDCWINAIGTLHVAAVDEIEISVQSGNVDINSTVDMGTHYLYSAVDLKLQAGDSINITGNIEFQGSGDIASTSGAVGVSPSNGTFEINGSALTFTGNVDGYINADAGDDLTITSGNDLFFDVGSGDYFEWQINDLKKLYLDGDSLDLSSNVDLNIGSNFVMDDTGISDASGDFDISVSSGNTVDFNVNGTEVVEVNTNGLEFNGTAEIDNTSGSLTVDGYTGVYTNVNNSTKWWVDGTGGYYGYLYGSAYATGDWVSGSDESLKTDVRPTESLIDRIRQIEIVRYKAIENGKESIGVIAQDLQSIFSEVVFCGDADEGGMCGVSAYQLASVALKGVQELADQVDAIADYSAQITALEARVSALEAKASDLAKQVAELQSGMSDLEARVAALEALLVAPEPVVEGE